MQPCVLGNRLLCRKYLQTASTVPSLSRLFVLHVTTQAAISSCCCVVAWLLCVLLLACSRGCATADQDLLGLWQGGLSRELTQHTAVPTAAHPSSKPVQQRPSTPAAVWEQARAADEAAGAATCSVPAVLLSVWEDGIAGAFGQRYNTVSFGRAVEAAQCQQ